ncbi:MAG TPA: hypothetical protein VK541_13035 [Pedobacter sp.]|nr:hypothetical protein [Pedobacter sp.]HMI03407.1 hypothetical protein [Pedobacter sp.]
MQVSDVISIFINRIEIDAELSIARNTISRYNGMANNDAFHIV